MEFYTMQNDESLLYEIAKKRKQVAEDNRKLQKLGIKEKEARVKSLEDTHGIYFNLLQHPSIKGHTTSVGTMLRRIQEIYDENLSLKKSHKLTDDLKYLRKFSFTYKVSGKKGIPSQKNQYGVKARNRYRHKSDFYDPKKTRTLYTSKETLAFRKDIVDEWGIQHGEPPMISFAHIDIEVMFSSFITSDLDGKVTTCLDAFKQANIIQDDSWLRLSFTPKSSYAPKAGFIATIYELDRDEFMKRIKVPKEKYEKGNAKWQV